MSTDTINALITRAMKNKKLSESDLAYINGTIPGWTKEDAHVFTCNIETLSKVYKVLDEYYYKKEVRRWPFNTHTQAI
jgi:hypothetical protein